MSKREELRRLRESAKKQVSIQEENEKNNPVDAFIPPTVSAEENRSVKQCEDETTEELKEPVIEEEKSIEQHKDEDEYKEQTQIINTNNTHKQDTQTEVVSLKDLITVDTKEAKSKRVNLLLKPSVHKEAQKVCKAMGISLNELTGQLLEAFVNDYKK